MIGDGVTLHGYEPPPPAIRDDRMPDYLHYDADALAADEYFATWCRGGDPGAQAFWSGWVARHPERAATVAEAREIVAYLTAVSGTRSAPGELAALWARIDSAAVPALRPARIGSAVAPVPRGVPALALPYALAAAGLIVVAAVVAVGLTAVRGSSAPRATAPAVTSVALPTGRWVDETNVDAEPRVIRLPDGSTVRLAPASTLSYPLDFGAGSRVVYLRGEAFFDVERDTVRPFAVFSDETITRVLGTSFSVRAYAGDDAVEVDVHSGEVNVYARVTEDGADGDSGSGAGEIVLAMDDTVRVPRPNRGVSLLPNHRVTFDRGARRLVLDVSRSPRLLVPPGSLRGRVYRDARCGEVVDALARAYGVGIDFADPGIRRCYLTTALSHGSLFAELDVICAALGLSYARAGGRITVEGEGCAPASPVPGRTH